MAPLAQAASFWAPEHNLFVWTGATLPVNIPHPQRHLLHKVEAYKGQATFVHIYGPEPHPQTPATNFDKGISWQSFWSVIPQPKSYGERMSVAERIVGMIHPKQVSAGNPPLPGFSPSMPPLHHQAARNFLRSCSNQYVAATWATTEEHAQSIW